MHNEDNDELEQVLDTDEADAVEGVFDEQNGEPIFPRDLGLFERSILDVPDVVNGDDDDDDDNDDNDDNDVSISSLPKQL